MAILMSTHVPQRRIVFICLYRFVIQGLFDIRRDRAHKFYFLQNTKTQLIQA